MEIMLNSWFILLFFLYYYIIINQSYMSKNSPKQLYTQTIEWLKTRGVKTSNTTAKKSRFNNYKDRGRK
jgi:hypothetical protein